MTRRIARLVALGLPARVREEVTGDLAEEALLPGTAGHLRGLAGVVLHVQIEPYRDGGARLWFVAALAGALALWTAVTAAGFGVLPELAPLWDPVSRLVLRFWSASHVTAALAAGLVLGHLPGPTSVGPARAHAIVLMAGLAGWHGGLGWAGGLAVAAVLSAGWIGSRARAERSRPRLV